MRKLTVNIPPETIAKLLKVTMSGVPLRRNTGQITSESISDSTPDPTSDSTPNSPLVLPPDSSPRPSLVPLSLTARLRDVFPPGLEATSASLRRLPYTFTPQHLLDVFTFNHGGRHASDTIVTSAWYGKQTKSARHEYIVVVIEDRAIPGLKNCMSIDRNQGGPAAQGGFPTVTAMSSSTNACDTFRVSYDGDLDRFLSESHLTPHHMLEQLFFQLEAPLPLHTLVTLVHYISEKYGKYNPVDTNCYWFTGLIWECMRRMRPGARCESYLPGKKGRIAFARNVTNPVQARNVIGEIQSKIGLSDPEILSPIVPTNEAAEDIVMMNLPGGGLAAVEIAGAELDVSGCLGYDSTNNDCH